MLRNSFIHVPGIGRIRERWLWRHGYHSWNDVLDGKKPEGWSEQTWEILIEHLNGSVLALERRDGRFFERRFSASDSWRFYEEYCSKAAYLDIETSGYGKMHEQTVTVIGVYDGEKVHHFVHGINMHEFVPFIRGFNLLVTYNGKAFDLPMINSRYPEAGLESIGHIDLRFVFAELGYKGGLKGIEKALGIERPDGIAGMDGYAAVICWRRYIKGREKYLETLLQYNAEDVKSLKPLAEMACAMARERLTRVFRASGGEGIL